MNTLHQFLFGIFPYIALAIFFFGSLVRFEREQYSWKSESSQVLYAGQLRLGNNLFHVGIIMIFFGHLVGLLTPIWIWDMLGISHSAKQIFAIVLGGVFGVLAMIGLILLLMRRLKCDRLAANTTWRDKLVLLWLIATLGMGLLTIFVSLGHLDGHEMVKFMSWAQHIVTFRGNAAAQIADVSIIFKIHMLMGMGLFVIFPFTRLVHIWSGFASVTYLTRAWQLVRRR
ncbi:MAG: respiratory nitrate reductase subunit gamma [Neisseria sp.]|nr:respiratory nitrate reductase subunit gamma [Neisseria sp.]